MTRWKKNETKFIVSLNQDVSRGAICIIPKPIVDKLGKPDKIRFVFLGKKIIVTAG